MTFDPRVRISAFLETFSLLGAVITESNPFPYDQVQKFTIAFRVWLLHLQNHNVGFDVIFIRSEKKIQNCSRYIKILLKKLFYEFAKLS